MSSTEFIFCLKKKNQCSSEDFNKSSYSHNDQNKIQNRTQTYRKDNQWIPNIMQLRDVGITRQSFEGSYYKYAMNIMENMLIINKKTVSGDK